MTDVPPSSIQSGAIQEVHALLQTSGIESQSLSRDGYIDTLGSQEALGPYAIHQVLHSKTLPRIYERWWRPVVSRMLFGWRGWKMAEEQRIALDLLGLSPGERVLDVACGPGNYTRRFGAAVGDGLVVGLDAAAEMLATAVEKGGGANLAYIRASGTSLPFEDGCFDVACCLAAIHMFDDPVKALNEMCRVLIPGGRLVVLTTHNPARKSFLLNRAPGFRMFERNELTDALADYGMVEIQQRVKAREQFVAARKPAS